MNNDGFKLQAGHSLDVNDTVRLEFGPFECTGTVTSVTEHGAIVKINDDATLIGFRRLEFAPDHTRLTNAPDETFIGRAHWRTTMVL